MTEALNEVEAEASVIFRQRRHALLVLRPLASSQLADPALEIDAGCEAGGALGAARLAFGDGALSHDRVFAALLGGGPLSEVAPFVYLIAEGNGLRVIARGPLRVVELPNAPQVGQVIVRSVFDRTLFVLGRAAAVAAVLAAGGLGATSHAGKTTEERYNAYLDRTLAELAALRPRTQGELLNVPGIGLAKAERYGEALLALFA